MLLKGTSPPAANRLMAPPSMVRPLGFVTATRSVVGPHSKERRAPSFSKSVPTDNVPAVTAVAGDKVPPLLMVAAMTDPTPSRVVSAFTVTAEFARVPLISSMPPLTCVEPAWVWLPLKVSVPAPTLTMPPGPEMLPA